MVIRKLKKLSWVKFKNTKTEKREEFMNNHSRETCFHKEESSEKKYLPIIEHSKKPDNTKTVDLTKDKGILSTIIGNEPQSKIINHSYVHIFQYDDKNSKSENFYCTKNENKSSTNQKKIKKSEKQSTLSHTSINMPQIYKSMSLKKESELNQEEYLDIMLPKRKQLIQQYSYLHSENYQSIDKLLSTYLTEAKYLAEQESQFLHLFNQRVKGQESNYRNGKKENTLLKKRTKMNARPNKLTKKQD